MRKSENAKRAEDHLKIYNLKVIFIPPYYKQVSNRILSMACVFRIWKSQTESKLDDDNDDDDDDDDYDDDDDLIRPSIIVIYDYELHNYFTDNTFQIISM